MRRIRLGMGVVLVLALMLAALWWHGGREPLRPIEQPVSVPEGVR